ncbi:restriction endonuclease subunit S [Staphylococcus cohnii]|uniref:restriction endonuclease subunit S n=1 Tax=Staphylococcus cohnii TaxID=29382 RepID=UPI003D7D821B
MTNQVKNEPELRFPGFEGEWKENFISEVVDFYSGLTYSPDDITNEKGTFVIRSSNIKNNRLINADNVYVNLKNLKVENVDKGDIIVVVRNGSRKLIGKHALVSTYLNNTVIGAFMTGIRSDYNFFINALLDTENFKRNIHMNLGATINQITTGMFKKMKFYFPKNQEQQKIGDFFSKLDRQIELEEQKLEKLEEQKKGYMQKIFSQELRFKDGNGNNYSEWIKTNLKFLVSYKNGKGYEKEVVQNGKYNIINLNSISTKGMLKDSGKYSDFEDITLKKNDLIMILSDVAKGNLIGKTAIIDQDDKYLLNQRVASLRIKDESTSNVLFIYYFINYFRQYFINMSTGMSQLNINKSTVEDFLIYLPYIEEQDKIGNFFSNLDKSIIKQLDKIELLKERKKGFLQKMFV